MTDSRIVASLPGQSILPLESIPTNGWHSVAKLLTYIAVGVLIVAAYEHYLVANESNLDTLKLHRIYVAYIVGGVLLIGAGVCHCVGDYFRACSSRLHWDEFEVYRADFKADRVCPESLDYIGEEDDIRDLELNPHCDEMMQPDLGDDSIDEGYQISAIVVQVDEISRADLDVDEEDNMCAPHPLDEDERRPAKQSLRSAIT